jgi:succinoglycan biosynthesis protein ExoM
MDKPLVVTVAVLTFKREADLRAGIPLVLEHASLLSAAIERPVDATVVVVDNDPAASGRAAIESMRAPVGVTLRYVVEPEPGIAAGRNRAIDESAGSDILVFIDDDERPREGWLKAIVLAWLASGAIAVMGRVVSEFDGELESWVRAGEFFRRRSMPTGTEIQVAAAGNLLIDRGAIERLGVRFDSALGLGAGEDSLFSAELVKRGGRITWCEESVATDSVPRARMTRAWVLERARSHGNVETVVALKLAHGPLGRGWTRISALVRGLVRVLGGRMRWLLGLITGNERHQARGMRTAKRGAGIAAGAFGHALQEYARN